MTEYAWFNIINRAAFEATGLISRELDLILEGIGSKTVVVTNANAFSLMVDDLFLPLGANDKNPFVFEDRAVYEDANGDVWYGVQISED